LGIFVTALLGIVQVFSYEPMNQSAVFYSMCLNPWVYLLLLCWLFFRFSHMNSWINQP